MRYSVVGCWSVLQCVAVCCSGDCNTHTHTFLSQEHQRQARDISISRVLFWLSCFPSYHLAKEKFSNGQLFTQQTVYNHYRAEPHCNTLQHTAITATHYKTLQNITTRCNILYTIMIELDTLQHTATHYNTLQHTATHYNTLQHTVYNHYRAATHCNALQHTATHCNTLQHTATHCIQSL